MALEGFWTFIFIIIASTIFIFSMTRSVSGESISPENANDEEKAL